jgi:Holliday junction DNA helicase RuvA
MYDYIRGKLVKKSPTEAVLDVQGIGYLLKISNSTYEKMPELEDIVTLKVYLHVREDVFQLFGFISEEEREVYIHLLTASGVGPKLALTILSGLTPQKLAAAIKNRDEAVLNSISGVGKKTAQRLIVELKDKFKNFDVSIADSEEPLRKKSLNSMESEAIMALISLGYSRMQAEKAVRKISPDGALSVEELIKQSLKVI